MSKLKEYYFRDDEFLFDDLLAQMEASIQEEEFFHSHEYLEFEMVKEEANVENGDKQKLIEYDRGTGIQAEHGQTEQQLPFD